MILPHCEIGNEKTLGRGQLPPSAFGTPVWLQKDSRTVERPRAAWDISFEATEECSGSPLHAHMCNHFLFIPVKKKNITVETQTHLVVDHSNN